MRGGVRRCEEGRGGERRGEQGRGGVRRCEGAGLYISEARKEKEKVTLR